MPSNCKLFVDDTSLFFQWLTTFKTVISIWAFQWKTIISPDLTEQVLELIFSRKTKELLHPSLSFNNIPLKSRMCQKHLGLILDPNLNFAEHAKIYHWEN